MSLLPEFIPIAGIYLSQTLIAAIFSNVLFLLLAAVYLLSQKVSPDNKFALGIDYLLEGITIFFQKIAGNLSDGAIRIIVFCFIYILWINVIGVVGDLIVGVVPVLHHYFKPVGTDITLNLLLAGFCVISSIVYGFIHNGPSHIKKYIPYSGLGIVSKVNSVGTFFGKIVDIFFGLAMGLIEFIGELSRILSLSLRLFGNIFAGMVLVELIIGATMSFFKVPALLPIIIIIFEFGVSFLQAFIFAVLVLVYFKMAGESHH